VLSRCWESAPQQTLAAIGLEQQRLAAADLAWTTFLLKPPTPAATVALK